MIRYYFLKHSRTARSQHRCRFGVTMIELVVSAVLLITIMCFVTSLSFRINLVWKDIGQHRVAVGELSNQLEHLTRLSRQDAAKALDSLTTSVVCARTLRNPELSGRLIDDNVGTRVVIQIVWERRHPGKPVELVGWLIPRSETGENAAQIEANQ